MRFAPLVLTPGEPAGIGPDLVVQLAQQDLPTDLVIIADPQLLLQRAKLLALPLTLVNYSATAPANNKKSQLTILPVPLAKTPECGVLMSENVPALLQTLQRATSGCLTGEFSALITGPVHKGIINQAGIKFSGHTEFLAQATHTPHVVMLLQSKQLRVAMVTTHLPLRAVAQAITPELLQQTLEILYNSLQKQFKVTKPRVLVCGLNPHAGENGYLGNEELTIITPTLEKMRARGMDLIGPVPADTAFIAQNLQHIDAVLTMYHDQGLPVIKYSDFEQAVNITLGLPFVRTSVDHGTALELAGTGQASAQSLLAAIYAALELR